ncbi:hypothetical protein HPB48_021270 [Haemaphysalis longicornis]|uniref:Uncharacterized protein n=1 Tax=Haemaphysalis longicornis TaxID=44386 RepID=A0A9J6GIE8_HAELO|nr:hypothetical protein HPB48_021270 [Haemaphysalis longicornis]
MEKKKVNITVEEKGLLMELARKYKDVIENKKNGQRVSTSEKVDVEAGRTRVQLSTRRPPQDTGPTEEVLGKSERKVPERDFL